MVMVLVFSIEAQLICNVSSVQQSDSVTHTYLCQYIYQYIYINSFQNFSIIDYYKMLTMVSCAIW